MSKKKVSRGLVFLHCNIPDIRDRLDLDKIRDQASDLGYATINAPSYPKVGVKKVDIILEPPITGVRHHWSGDPKEDFISYGFQTVKQWLSCEVAEFVFVGGYLSLCVRQMATIMQAGGLTVRLFMPHIVESDEYLKWVAIPPEQREWQERYPEELRVPWEVPTELRQERL